MTGEVLRLGTRASALATTQSRQVAALLEAAGVRCELVLIRTEGDVNRAPLASIGGTGVFVTAVRDALLAGEVDVAVHSYKDLPTAAAPGIRLAAVPVREDPFDALCAGSGSSLAALPPGTTVGTGSPRRRAQLLALRPDLRIQPVRGNVDTRLALVTSGSLDAVVLARAGLSRLGRADHITETFTADQLLPAPAQGALAIECRDEDDWYLPAFEQLNDMASRTAVSAERSLLATLEAGCSAPVGALATVNGSGLALTGAVIAVDGSASVRGSVTGDAGDPIALGERLAFQLLAQGAGTLLALARS